MRKDHTPVLARSLGKGKKTTYPHMRIFPFSFTRWLEYSFVVHITSNSLIHGGSKRKKKQKLERKTTINLVGVSKYAAPWLICWTSIREKGFLKKEKYQLHLWTGSFSWNHPSISFLSHHRFSLSLCLWTQRDKSAPINSHHLPG